MSAHQMGAWPGHAPVDMPWTRRPTLIRRAARIIRRTALTTLQVVAAGGLAVMVAAVLGLDHPVGALLFAITGVEFICARHHRSIAVFLFGVTLGLAAAAVAAGYRTLERGSIDLIIGIAVAVLVAYLTTPRNPEQQIIETTEPILTNVTRNIRTIASALRNGDADAAQAALQNLAETDDDLHRLKQIVLASRRAAVITPWSTERDLHRLSTGAREIGFAVRNVRVMARHAWFGVLRTGERVPAALPPMLDALADGVSLLRDEWAAEDTQPELTHKQLVAAARWIDVLREEKLSTDCAVVAANAGAAVLNLLLAAGTPMAQANAMLRDGPELVWG